MPDPTEPWFVVNATEKPWEAAPGWGRSVAFDTRDAPFPDYGINIHVLEPGERSTMYHGEAAQEGFLVLSGSPTLIVEGEERVLKAWDYVHCPAWTRHAFANASDAPCTILMTGARSAGVEPDCVYPVDPVAQRHGAGVRDETPDPSVAYAEKPRDEEEPYRRGTLPGA
ncbi:MAG TPA: cupin domain-containing protein [Baekduia sp.]|uniref:cupin domain-containing protein n=1 Tax=Baekduia sp. TaxID=2600305 RepID=UPI002D795D3C|nr:cupin domain-containing protein [Baekduia sp.]HET6509372.1 cupin domain-containing protein [Baekduia sp.]